ncbi:XRE family transcriptional regulator [Streptomyces tsukubensis]
MEGNENLADAMHNLGFKQLELADAVNDRLRAQGYEGTVGDRTVRNWLAGKTRWPHRRQREALEALFACTAEELGFSPPARQRTSTSPEGPVNRRNFLTAAGNLSAAAAIPQAGAPPVVGTSDVLRLRSGLDALMALDDTQGGHEALERAALAGATEALAKQKLAATQRIRQRLYAVAADYTATAAWSALDARRCTRAQMLLSQAHYLAGMAQDSAVELRVWNSYAMLAHQQGRYGEAVDAAQAAQAATITRRDPLFASLAHARTAVGHSALGDRQSALRSLGCAQEALDKAQALPRPSWVAFYGSAELAAVTSIVRDRVGDFAEAEAASHQALSSIPTPFLRNRAMATTRLALAQLHQRDKDQACATASTVFSLMSGHPVPGRMRSLLGDFYRDLITLAPNARVAREWEDRYRSEWS